MRWINRYFLILIFYSFSCFPQQDKKLDSLISVYTKAESDTDRITKYSDIAIYIANKGRYKEAITYYEKIIQTFSKTHPTRCIDAKNRIVLNYISAHELGKVDTLVKEVMEESTKLNYLKGIGWANRNLGLLNSFKDKYKEAVEYHLKALKIWEDTKNKKMISVSNSDLGIAFYFQGNKEKAVFYFENSLKTKPDTTSADYLSDLGNLGSVYTELGKLDKATACLIRVLRHYEATKSYNKYAGVLVTLANIEYKRKNYTQAINYYMEVIKIREKENGSQSELASAYVNLAATYLAIDKPKEALAYVLKGYQKALESEDKHELMHAYTNLGAVYNKLGNNERAYQYALLFNNLKDSLTDDENKKQATELDQKYQTEKKEKDNQLLSQQLEIQQIQGKQQKMFLIISGVVLVLIAMLAIVFFNQNKQKHKTNLKLEAKNKIIEEQKVLVDKAYVELHEKNKEVMDSIHYAKRIQSALITNEKYIERSLNKLMGDNK